MKYMTLFSPKKITENWRFYSKAFRIKQLIYMFCIALMDNLLKPASLNRNSAIISYCISTKTLVEVKQA